MGSLSDGSIVWIYPAVYDSGLHYYTIARLLTLAALGQQQKQIGPSSHRYEVVSTVGGKGSKNGRFESGCQSH